MKLTTCFQLACGMSVSPQKVLSKEKEEEEEDQPLRRSRGVLVAHSPSGNGPFCFVPTGASRPPPHCWLHPCPGSSWSIPTSPLWEHPGQGTEELCKGVDGRTFWGKELLPGRGMLQTLFCPNAGFSGVISSTSLF